MKRESLKIKSDNENRLKYVEENVVQLEQQERFYKERVFTFQYGSIKGVSSSLYCSYFFKFTFQYGSIKGS